MNLKELVVAVGYIKTHYHRRGHTMIDSVHVQIDPSGNVTDLAIYGPGDFGRELFDGNENTSVCELLKFLEDNRSKKKRTRRSNLSYPRNGTAPALAEAEPRLALGSRRNER